MEWIRIQNLQDQLASVRRQRDLLPSELGKAEEMMRADIEHLKKAGLAGSEKHVLLIGKQARAEGIIEVLKEFQAKEKPVAEL